MSEQQPEALLALQQAVDDLATATSFTSKAARDRHTETVTRARAALSRLQAERGEPVGEVIETLMPPGPPHWSEPVQTVELRSDVDLPAGTKLYTHPAAPAKLAPLTVLQYNAIPELCAIKPSLYESVVRSIERALSAHNGLTTGTDREAP